MARLILTALMISILDFAGTDCGSAKAPSPQSRETKAVESPTPPAVVLTEKQPKSSSAVPVAELNSDAEVLEVEITKVVNPKLTPVTVFVYLSNTAKDKSEPERHLVGNFSLYPPDQPGKFLLSAAPALRKVSAAAKASKTGNVVLEFEMKLVDEARGWTPIELMIANPKWRAAEK